ncbi:hypothetical protein P280DRAFT_464802 [Massarina eburnea CBS 473.64]|uniref:ATP-dependent DNA ligase family profile domain-containing protein n=1 Tax=Massarina eburnea CBS 473.64 TaxID=1395130 RepID=A0A6A6SJN6_9PLEO|nr:hypothetical protein P280DRAFT_464802 [Massarina eburnea CBS 473.64]
MSITFNDVCTLLEGVENISARQSRLLPTEDKKDKQLKIKTTILHWFDARRRALDSPETNGGAILSTLFPHRRKDRVYGLQPPGLSKKLLKLLNLNHGAQMIFGRWSTESKGDLGFYTQAATKPWDGTIRKKQHFSIDRIDKLLTQLAAKYRFSDASIQKQHNPNMNIDMEFAHILHRLDSWEMKWFVRLILRNFATIELDETYIFRCYHFLLPDLLRFQNDFDAAFRILRKDFSEYPSAPGPSLEHSMRTEAAGKIKAVVGVKVARPLFYKAWTFKHCLQLVGNHPWAAEVKYDGEYCEIHVNLDDAPNDIKIFSKNGKEATADRQLLHDTIRQALRIGRADCMFKRKCIVLGEMVLYSDKESKILSFSKIRKHVTRSGSFLGTFQDSLPHEWEHLMLVYFDVLMLDDEPVMHRCLQDRRTVLRELVQTIPGRSQRSEWTLLDFKSKDGSTDLTQAFARTLAHHQEGLVLKPLHSPYFPIFTDVYQRRPKYFIKVKKDYLADMGGQRDLGDFAVIGGRYDPQVAPKTDVRPLFWTHFYLGCLMNKLAVDLRNEKPKFKVVGCLNLDKCIPKPELKYLNDRGQFHKVTLHQNGSIDAFDIEHGRGYDRRMSVAFKRPFVAEILGGGYEKVQNETFEMLRHPRIKKIHHDRTWEDTVSMKNLQKMAEEKWEVPDTAQLDGLAKDVAMFAKKYAKELGSSQTSVSEYETTQETPCTTQRHSSELELHTSNDAVQSTPQQTPTRSTQESSRQALDDSYEIAETQDIAETCTTVTSSQVSCGTQGKGIRASREMRVLVRKDTSEQPPTIATTTKAQANILPTPPSTSNEMASTVKKRSFAGEIISPPSSKRKNMSRIPLEASGGNKKLGSFDYNSQDKTIHIYAEKGFKVQVHCPPEKGH